MIQMQKNIKSLEEGLQEFIVECKIKNLSQTTIKYYEQCFKYFIEYINANAKITDIKADISKKTVDSYIIYMQTNKLKVSTINIRLRGIRSILYYFMKCNYIEKFEIKQIKEEESIPNLYTDEEIVILLRKPDTRTCTFSEYRTWVIINFFVATGVRSRTLRNIQIKDLDFENDLIYLNTTKSRKSLIIPMSIAIKKILIEYLKVRRGDKEDYVFCNLEGEKLTKSALSNIVSRYNRSRGVQKTGIHLLRHFFAKKYIQNGGNALRLQKILGHSTLKQTQRYVDLFGNDLKVDFNEVSPLDNLYGYKERIKIRA